MLFKKVNQKLTPSGYWDNSLYYKSAEELLIPDEMKDQIIREDFDAKGLADPITKITVGNNSWLIWKEA